jgi:hypothetical protein
VAAVDRGGAAGREVFHYVAFLPSEETAEAVRTASKAQLVALTLPDVPAMADAAPWTFTIEPDWNVTVKQIIDAAGRHGAPIIDRRTVKNVTRAPRKTGPAKPGPAKNDAGRNDTRKRGIPIIDHRTPKP